MNCGMCNQPLPADFAAEVNACRRVVGLAVNLKPICDACDRDRTQKGEVPPVYGCENARNNAPEPRHATNDRTAA